MARDSDAFRKYAENCLFLAEKAANEPTAIRYRRMARAWLDLATEQDWLDGYPTQNDRAAELANDAIDSQIDESATGTEIKDRKRQLIHGPAEFRGARLDTD
jgi:hypothetical protein